MERELVQPLRSMASYPTPRRSTAGRARGAGFEAAKRVTDVAVSAAMLSLLSPLLLAISVSIKLTSRGPIIFTQERLGRGGRPFACRKFRTMVRDAEARLAACDDLAARFDQGFKIKGDPRVTPVGAFLRRASLDELPQLWNVLRGDMSLIGPRPIVERELVKYGRFADALLSVKPGLGGIWQVSGRSDTTYAERVAMDMKYVRSRSLGLDFLLLARTAVVVLRGRGAY